MREEKKEELRGTDLHPSNRLFCLIKYLDNTSQLLTVTQTTRMLQRQLNDKIFMKFQYIQLFLPIKDYIDRNFFTIIFDYKTEKTTPLFKRAKKALLVEIDDVPEASKDYISPDKEYNYENWLL